MNCIVREQIKKLFNDPPRTMTNGLWFSGYEDEGEYKNWYPSGNPWEHSFSKNNRLHGEFKKWYDNGKLQEHGFYKDGKQYGKFKMWNEKGELRVHKLYKNNEAIRDYLK